MNPRITSLLFEEGVYLIPNEETTDQGKLSLKGKKDSKVLCLFIKEDFSHPGDEELILAENILAAVDIHKKDYAWAYSKDILENLDFNQENVFIFHSGNHVSHEDFPVNKWIDKNETLILRTHSLVELISDKQKKVALWSKLKEFKEKA